MFIAPVPEAPAAQANISLLTLWHAYQPPGQTEYWVRRIAEECYGPIAEWLATQSDFHVAFNINHSLVRQLHTLGLERIIENLGRAAENGSIEFTDSAAYHAILPNLLRHEGGDLEAARQIELNNKLNREIFQGLWNPKGFFPPEMAFSNDLATLLKKMGYEWAITDAALFDAANPGSTIPHTVIGQVEGLPVFFRSAWSNEFSQTRPNRGYYDVSRFVNDMGAGVSCWFGGQNGHVVIAYDAETLGHHIPQYGTDALSAYSERCKEIGIKSRLFSEALAEFDKINVKIQPGSWSTTIEDIGAGEHFPLWSHSQNPVHRYFWELTQYAIRIVHEAEIAARSNKDVKREYETARNALDEGLHSCKEWWANPLHGKWDPDKILAGENQLLTAIRYGISTIGHGIVTDSSPREYIGDRPPELAPFKRAA